MTKDLSLADLSPALDVLICGAGAAGLTLAIELARRGIRFRLVEQMSDPFPGSRGKGIQPRTLEVFEDLGIIDRILAAGGAYPPERVYRADGGTTDSNIVTPQDPTPAEPYPMPVMLPQFLTEGIMRERLLELRSRPELGCALVGLTQDTDSVTAQLAGKAGEESVRARFLVGADGGRSFVRKALGIGFPGKTLGVRALVADVALTGLGRDAWHRFNEGTNDQIMLCPLAGTDLFQVQGPIPPEGEIDLSAEALSALVARRTGRADIRIHSVAWASAYTMNARLADQYRVGRVFLIGDAAHIHPPTGGQGLNTSVQDATNLGWKLAAVASGAPTALLDTYEEERRPIAAGMLGLSTKLLDAAKQGDIRRGRETRQLDLGYPGSSLALERPERARGLRAGDRAPDATLASPTDRPMRLFDLFRGPHWTLLGDAVACNLPAPRPDLTIHIIGPRGDSRDALGHFRDAYGTAPGDWVLVRPDGYIGAIVDGDHVPALAAYLRQVGLEVEDQVDA